jgi:hypothetical protein
LAIIFNASTSFQTSEDTDELINSSWFADVVFKLVDKFFASFITINISKKQPLNIWEALIPSEKTTGVSLKALCL